MGWPPETSPLESDPVCRLLREDQCCRLILLGELASGLLGQAQAAPHLPVDHDRHAKEAAHHRMLRVHAVSRMPMDIAKAQWARVQDQIGHQPTPGWRVANRLPGAIIHARGREVLELVALLIED